MKKITLIVGKALLAILDGTAEASNFIGDYLHSYLYHLEKAEKKNDTIR